MRKLIVWTILFAAAILGHSEDQNWTENSLTVKLNDQQSVRVVSEIKYRSWDWADGVFLKNWVVGYDQKWRHGIAFGAHYKQELTRRVEGPDILERRIGLDASWGKRMAGDTRFDIRGRLEIRHFDESAAVDHYRLRIRFRLRDQWQIRTLKLEPFISLEPFYDTITDSFSRYRFSVGSMIPLNRYAKLRVAYLRQDKQGKPPEHVFNTGISVIF